MKSGPVFSLLFLGVLIYTAKFSNAVSNSESNSGESSGSSSVNSSGSGSSSSTGDTETGEATVDATAEADVTGEAQISDPDASATGEGAAEGEADAAANVDGRTTMTSARESTSITVSATPPGEIFTESSDLPIVNTTPKPTTPTPGPEEECSDPGPRCPSCEADKFKGFSFEETKKCGCCPWPCCCKCIGNPEKCYCCCTPEQFWANGGATYYKF